MVNVAALLVPPPGVGVKTVTVAVPAVVKFVAGTVAESWLALTNAVVRAVPFQLTVEVEIKLLPLTERVRAEAPAVAEVGEILLSTGAGLFATALIVNVEEELAPPPGVGVTTVTEAVPAVVRLAAGTVAVS